MPEQEGGHDDSMMSYDLYGMTLMRKSLLLMSDIYCILYFGKVGEGSDLRQETAARWDSSIRVDTLCGIAS